MHHAVLNLAKIKHREPEARLNPFLIHLSSLEQMSAELTDSGHNDMMVPVAGAYIARNLA